MKRLLALALGVLLSVVMVTVAKGQEAECKGDIKKICKDATGKDVLTCIEQHKGEYSAACKKKIEGVKDKWPGLVKACQPELEKSCGDKKVGDGTLGKCVKANEGKMGNDCKTAYAQMKGMIPGGAKMPAGLKMP